MVCGANSRLDDWAGQGGCRLLVGLASSVTVLRDLSNAGGGSVLMGYIVMRIYPCSWTVVCWMDHVSTY